MVTASGTFLRMVDDVFAPVRGYANTMIPTDRGTSLAELVRIALFNIDHFDRVPMAGEEVQIGRTTVDLTRPKTHRQQFEYALAEIAHRRGWTAEQCASVASLKKRCPPDRIYRVRGGLHSARHGWSPIGIIIAYKPGIAGGAAEAGVAILGVSGSSVGSPERPLAVPAEALEDVTEDARSARLTELRQY